jgi:beta-1,4-mannosyltransferase
MIRQYNIIIIQNPPCLPALLAARIIAVFNGSIVVIDWHNLGYAMFEQRLGSKHLLVRLAFTLEKFACRQAHKHICVSSAMKDWLAEHFTIQATVLYDRPAKLFVKDSPTLRERHHLLSSLEFSDDLLFPNTEADGEINRNLKNDTNGVQKSEGSTCQTYCKTQQKCEGGGDDGDANNIILKEKGCKMIVSATSWTEDEDFSMLLVALQELNLLLTTHSTSTSTSTTNLIAVEGSERIVVVVTGKGPLKAEFESSVLDLRSRGLLDRVAIRTAWLSSTDYSLLLRCADLGICLHTSTSGLDLPMKVNCSLLIALAIPLFLLLLLLLSLIRSFLQNSCLNMHNQLESV